MKLKELQTQFEEWRERRDRYWKESHKIDTKQTIYSVTPKDIIEIANQKIVYNNVYYKEY